MMEKLVFELVHQLSRLLFRTLVRAFVVRSYYVWFALNYTNYKLPLWPFWAAMLALQVAMADTETEHQEQLKRQRMAEYGLVERGWYNGVLFLVTMGLYWLTGLALAFIQTQYLQHG